MERKFGARLFSGTSEKWDGSETASLSTAGEDDRYGYQIGQYDENDATKGPPPPGLYHFSDTASTVTFEENQMAQILDEEWEEDDEDEREQKRRTMADAVVFRPPVSPSKTGSAIRLQS